MDSSPAHTNQSDGGSDTTPIPVVPSAETVALRSGRNSARITAPIAVLLGLLCGMPHVLMFLDLRAEGKTYAPLVVEDITSVTYDEATYHAPRIREVLDGHFFSADADSLEHKHDTPFLGQGWLDTTLAGLLGFLLGRSAPNVFIVCDFILPPLSFLLLFALCRRLGAPEWVAVAASLFCILFHGEATLPIALAAKPSWELLAGRLSLLESARPVEFCRLTSPQLIFIPCAAALLGIAGIHDQPRLRRAVLTGLAIGALFYCYVFYWTFVLVGGVLLLLGCCIERQGRRALPMLALALAIGVLIGLPVLYQALTPDGFDGKSVLMARRDGGRLIRWAFQKHELMLTAMLLLLYPKRRREFAPLAAFLVAPFACIFAARATGMNTEEWHWLGRCWQPWAALMCVMILWAWLAEIRRRLARRSGEDADALEPGRLARAERRVSIAFAVIATLMLLCAANKHIRFARSMAESYTLSADVQQAFIELHLRAPRDSVVMAINANMLALIPVYTHCNAFLPYCLLTPMENDEIIDRAGVTLGAYGLGDAAILELLKWPEGRTSEEISLNRGHAGNLSKWLFFHMLADYGTPPEAKRRIKDRARFHGPDGIAETRDKYRVDFIWWGPLERKLGRPDLEARLADKLFIQAGDVKVYKLTRAQ